MVSIKVSLIFSSIIVSIIGISPVKSESLVENVCEQISGQNSSSEMLTDNLGKPESDRLAQLAENLGLTQHNSERWICKHIENGKWFGLFDISMEGETQIKASTFLLDGKFQTGQKDAAISFFRDVIAEMLLLGEGNKQEVRDTLADYLGLMEQGMIIPDQLDEETLSQELQDVGTLLNQVPSEISDGWINDDAIPVNRLVVFDDGVEQPVVAYSYIVPIVHVNTKEILQRGINITIQITGKQELNVTDSPEP